MGNAARTDENALTKGKSKLFYGWWIALACAAINVYFGGAYFQGFSAFFVPIVTEFRWSYATLSLVLALRSAETGLFSPFLGTLADKFGPRNVMLGGAVLSGAGAVWLSTVHSLGAFYAGVLLMALGASACSGIVIPMTAVANWFDKKMGRAVAVVSMGFGLGGILVPVVVWLIEVYGWRQSMFYIGVGIWVLCIPLTLVVRHKPEQYGYLPDGAPRESKDATPRVADPLPVEFSTREALGTQAFWMLSITMFLGFLAIGAVLVHLMPYFESIGFGRGSAGLIITAVTVTSLGGRLGFGWLSETVDERKLLAIIFVLEAVGMFMLAYAKNPWFLVAFVATYAVAQGAQGTLRPAIIRDYYGRSSFGGILGMLRLGGVVASIIAPFAAGWLFDLRGSYYLTWIIFGSAAAVGAPLVLMIKRPVKRAH